MAVQVCTGLKREVERSATSWLQVGTSLKCSGYIQHHLMDSQTPCYRQIKISVVGWKSGR